MGGPQEAESGEGEYLRLFLVFVLLFVITSQRFKLGGSMLPPLPRRCPSGIPSPPPLPPCTQPFTVDMVGLPPHRTLRQGDPCGALRAYLRSSTRKMHVF
jgi:hypothetical protein